jgi:hypothetical protein
MTTTVATDFEQSGVFITQGFEGVESALYDRVYHITQADRLADIGRMGLYAGRNRSNFEFAEGEAWVDSFRPSNLPVSRLDCVFASLDANHVGASGARYLSKALLSDTVDAEVLEILVDPSKVYVLDALWFDKAAKTHETVVGMEAALAPYLENPDSWDKNRVASPSLYGSSIQRNLEEIEWLTQDAEEFIKHYWRNAIPLVDFKRLYQRVLFSAIGFEWALRDNSHAQVLDLPEQINVPEVLVPVDDASVIPASRIRHIASSLLRSSNQS